MSKLNKRNRTSHGLRDALFDELEQLRGDSPDPQRAMAVANVAKQIVNIAKVELDFHREAVKHAESGARLEMGTMQLGSSSAANSAGPSAVEH